MCGPATGGRGGFRLAGNAKGVMMHRGVEEAVWRGGGGRERVREVDRERERERERERCMLLFMPCAGNKGPGEWTVLGFASRL